LILQQQNEISLRRDELARLNNMITKGLNSQIIKCNGVIGTQNTPSFNQALKGDEDV
jgi:hypothetical protein